jgi:hypothetical protein
VATPTILLSSNTPFTSKYRTFAIDDSSAESWLDIAQTMEVQQDLSSHSQDEIVKPDKVIKDPIYLFGQFVSTVTSLKDIQPGLEVS